MLNPISKFLFVSFLICMLVFPYIAIARVSEWRNTYGRLGGDRASETEKYEESDESEEMRERSERLDNNAVDEIKIPILLGVGLRNIYD